MDCPVLCLSRFVVCTIFGSLGSWMGGWLVSLCLVHGLGYFVFPVGWGWVGGVIGGSSHEYVRCSMQ